MNNKTFLHLELTNRCTLKCPACPRTVWQSILKSPPKKADLDMDALEKFLDCDGGRKIDSFFICGDYGDPIYYPNLLPLLRKFRDTKTYHIVTNGSYKSEQFWNELAEILTEEDRVTFSIDGLEDTNHIYRVNSDWPSIMLGIDIMARSRARVVWKTIIFNYNYTQLADIKKFALDKGVEFEAQKTHRFDNCEELTPPADLVESNHLYVENFSSDDHVVVEPWCTIEKVITSDGYFFPCDFIRNPKTLYKSQLWKQRSRWIEKLKIQDINYDDGMKIIQDWADFVKTNSVENNGLVDVICKMKCRVGCRQNAVVTVGD